MGALLFLLLLLLFLIILLAISREDNYEEWHMLMST